MATNRYEIEKIKLNYASEKEQHEAENSLGHEITEDDLELKNTKVTVTIRLDADVLQALKEQAEIKKCKYQTFLNAFLRKHLTNNEPTALDDLIRRVTEIERKIG